MNETRESMLTCYYSKFGISIYQTLWQNTYNESNQPTFTLFRAERFGTLCGIMALLESCINPNPRGCMQNRIQIGGFWGLL